MPRSESSAFRSQTLASVAPCSESSSGPPATSAAQAVAAVHEHPDLELVGALVYSDDKAGRDVGEVCGIGPDRRDRHHRPRRDRRPRRRLRPLHGAGRDGPDGRARRHLPPARQRQERRVDRGHRLHLPGEPRARGGRPPRGGLRRGRHVVPRHRHRAGVGRRGAAAHDVGDPPPGRLDPRAGADGLQHLRQPRHDVRHHGLRAAARRRRCRWPTPTWSAARSRRR